MLGNDAENNEGEMLTSPLGRMTARRKSHGVSIMVYYWRTCGYRIDGHRRKPGGAIEIYESGELRRKSRPRSLGSRYLHRPFRAWGYS